MVSFSGLLREGDANDMGLVKDALGGSFQTKPGARGKANKNKRKRDTHDENVKNVAKATVAQATKASKKAKAKVAKAKKKSLAMKSTLDRWVKKGRHPDLVPDKPIQAPEPPAQPALVASEEQDWMGQDEWQPPPYHGDKVDKKNVHSRAYHHTTKVALKQGYSKEEAKGAARTAAQWAVRDM